MKPETELYAKFLAAAFQALVSEHDKKYISSGLFPDEAMKMADRAARRMVAMTKDYENGRI